MSGFDTTERWREYFWEPPHDHVLRNIPGIRDAQLLRQTEDTLYANRRRQIEAGGIAIPQTYDAAHLQAIHGAIFDGLYEWAGRFRDVSISKTDTFTNRRSYFCPPMRLDEHMAVIGTAINNAKWKEWDRDRVAEACGRAHTRLNYVHPFREGNGRSARIFMTHACEQTPWTPDYDKVSANEWNAASAATFPDDAFAPDTTLNDQPLIDVYKRILVDREPHNPAPDVTGVRRILDLTYGSSRPALSGEIGTYAGQPTPHPAHERDLGPGYGLNGD